jgi:hypothetical protein
MDMLEKVVAGLVKTTRSYVELCGGKRKLIQWRELRYFLVQNHGSLCCRKRSNANAEREGEATIDRLEEMNTKCRGVSSTSLWITLDRQAATRLTARRKRRVSVHGITEYEQLHPYHQRQHTKRAGVDLRCSAIASSFMLGACLGINHTGNEITVQAHSLAGRT